jgi:protein-S-isoprenylcysteine O-methyltransferase Ste14
MIAGVNSGWIFILGMFLLVVLGAVIAKRLPPEYRTRRTPTIGTVATAWVFLGLHFTLVVLAVLDSTWHFNLPPALAAGAGVVFAVLGAAIYLSAIYAYRSFKRLQGLDTTRLVTDGIYRWSRNPQAVGWTLVLVGAGLVRESAMVLLLAGGLWLAFRLYLPVEEELVHRLFGDAYERYRRRTHRYFGPPREDVAE